MAKTPVIKASNLSKTFKLGKNEITALHSVDFEIFSGEFICFFGPSGCGKSTLLSMLAGLQPPSSGKVLVRGKDLSVLGKKEISKYRRSKIGMVFQQFNLILSMNVLENIALPMAFDGVSRKRRAQRAQHLLSVVGLDDKKKDVPADLSGGQQQRVAVARSLINNPWIIMADEPTGNLDSQSADEVMKLLVSLSRKSKRTVILITHNPDYLKFADRVFKMKDGHILTVEKNKKVAKVELLDSVSKLGTAKDEEAEDDIDIETDKVVEKDEESSSDDGTDNVEKTEIAKESRNDKGPSSDEDALEKENVEAVEETEEVKDTGEVSQEDANDIEEGNPDTIENAETTEINKEIAKDEESDNEEQA